MVFLTERSQIEIDCRLRDTTDVSAAELSHVVAT
jgi:hypothetical protein